MRKHRDRLWRANNICSTIDCIYTGALGPVSSSLSDTCLLLWCYLSQKPASIVRCQFFEGCPRSCKKIYISRSASLKGVSNLIVTTAREQADLCSPLPKPDVPFIERRPASTNQSAHCSKFLRFAMKEQKNTGSGKKCLEKGSIFLCVVLRIDGDSLATPLSFRVNYSSVYNLRAL